MLLEAEMEEMSTAKSRNGLWRVECGTFTGGSVISHDHLVRIAPCLVRNFDVFVRFAVRICFCLALMCPLELTGVTLEWDANTGQQWERWRQLHHWQAVPSERQHATGGPAICPLDRGLANSFTSSASAPTDLSYTISSTGKRHNSRCRYYGSGRPCGPTDGVACNKRGKRSRLVFAHPRYGSRILPQFQSERRDAVGGLLQASDPIPQRSQIFIVERQYPNALIKLDRIPKALFRLLNATGDTCVAGQVECDHCNPGMYRLRPQQNGLRLLNALVPPDGIGEVS